MRYTTSDLPFVLTHITLDCKAHRGPNNQRFSLTEQATTDILEYFDIRGVTTIPKASSVPLEDMDAWPRQSRKFEVAAQ